MNTDKSRRMRAHEAIAEAMTAALELWFAPAGRGAVCHDAEARMVERIGKVTACGWSEHETEELSWFFRERYLTLDMETFIPWFGSLLHVVEVFALGQFALACAENGVEAGDATALRLAWEAIQPIIWSGVRIVAFYEAYASQPFPWKAKGTFIRAVHEAGRTARGIATPAVA